MKAKGITLILLTLLLTACGKENRSGQTGINSPYTFGNPYYSGYGTPNLGSINSPYSYGGMSVNSVLQQNPCISGFAGYGGMTGNYAGQRIPIQVPMLNFPTVISPNDIYVGVTSYGDVGVVVGRPVGQPPLFVGYMCPRQFAQSGSGQLMGVKVGAYTQCLFKPITAATVVFPGGGSAEFRMLDGGTSAGFAQNRMIPFNFCRN